MDPRLVRLFEQGAKDDEVAALLRLSSGQPVPAGVRQVARFGDIATVRVRRRDIPSVHDAPMVASMKPAAPLLRETPSPNEFASTTAAQDIRRPPGLQATGRGVVVGLIDWGFDFAYPDFRNVDGTTRLLALWDQRPPAGAASPAPYNYGVMHLPDAINAALAAPNPYAALNYNPADSDTDGKGTHGTHVAGIVAGNGRAGGPSGIAPNADIIFVELTGLDPLDPDLADSAALLEAIDFIRRVAGSRPWVINLSMGQCGDQHDGTTLIEQGFDAVLAEAPGRAIVQSTGNYFGSRLHASGRLRAGERRSLTWRVPAGNDTNEVEIWYSGGDAITVSLHAPDGGLTGRAALGQRVNPRIGGRVIGGLFNRRRDPNNFDNHIVLWLNPDAPSGDWRLTLTGTDVADGSYHVWVQRGDDNDGAQASLARADTNPYFTTNSICNGRRTIAVGAYNARVASPDVAAFSSAGPTRDGRSKPDLLAPGVNILSARSTPAGGSPGEGLYVRMTGTSMAAPHVAGTVALMFEAAPRPLTSDETSGLLASSTRPADRGERDAIRYGSGFLDITAAVEAARGSAALKGVAEMVSDPTAAPLNADIPSLADALIGIGGPFAASPGALLAQVLSHLGVSLAAGLPDPAGLFDGYTTARSLHLRPLLDQLFAIVALPRQRLTQPIRSGDILLRRALGEPGLGHAAFIAGLGAFPPDAARSRGLRPESSRPGLYAHVVESGTHPHRTVDRFARRIADAEGQLAADTLILRPLPGGSRRRPIEQAAPAAAVVAPPAAVANWRLGVDFSSYQNVHDAGFENLRSHQKVFAILKSSQGQVRDGKFLADPHDVAHSDYYAKARAHGFIRGSYHFLANKRGLHSLTFSGTIEQQVNMVKSTVPPLLPGDLTPALDLEDQENHGRFPLDQGVFPDEHGYHYRTHWPTHAAGRRELLTDIQDFLDRIETAYGRTPIIYTSIMWADTDDMDNPPDLDPDYPLSNYPLWNVYHARRDDHGVLIPIDQISAGGWGPNWTFVQYAEQGHQWWGMANYREPGINIPGLDFDAFRNSLYELRGLADIGRLGVAFLGAAPFIAFADLDNHLHVRPEPTSAAGQDLTGLLPGSSNDTAQPRISGDPVLLASPNAFYLYFRGGDHLVEASAPFANQLRWRAIDIEDTVNNTPVKPLHDPRAAILGNRRYIVYVGDDLDWHLVVCSETGRRSWSGILTSAGLPARRTAGQPTIQATGQPTVYISATIIHLVGRVYQDGQLFYLTFDGTNWSPPEDITLGVQHLAPTLYAATCSPCIFETTRGLAVVYRAVRGDLWVVPRGGDAPVNLMVATRTPAAGRASAASGHPTCFVLRDIPHVVYRGVDGQIRDMWLDAGNWQVRLLCPGDANKAAADPVATANGTTAYVVYRGTDEQIHTASFDGTTWTCNTTGN